jgi:hypothetical protein
MLLLSSVLKVFIALVMWSVSHKWRLSRAPPLGSEHVCTVLSCMQVMNVFEAARAAFPSAVVKASTFEAFVDQLVPFKSHLGTLPHLLMILL